MTDQPRADAVAGAATTLGPIDHVAVVVRSVDASLPRYRELFGLEPMGPAADFPGQRVRIAFLRTGPPPAAKIELIEPLDTESGVARFLAARGEGLHHVCLASADLPRDLAALAAAEAELIDATPRDGAHGQVAFVHPHALNGVLWELLAPDREP
jgi:methylmalonyl-CoA/ethylmalonyl-CoA epimerase